MDIIGGMIFTFCVLIFSVLKGIYVGIPLFLSFLTFALISWKREFSLKDIYTMSYNGSKKSFVVLKIFLFIGAITSVWMAAGTVPGIVYYGIKFMNPKFFILYSFLICTLVSFLLGTALGTVSTAGLALIVMARSGNMNLNIAAGAIMAGAYFGDRCSPMSSSANLVANLTETDLYTNIRNMFLTGAIPFVLSTGIYTFISLNQPLTFSESSIHSDLTNTFYIHWIVLVPAMIILLLSLFKVNVKHSMSLSILSAGIIGISLQNYSVAHMFQYLLLGFHLEPSHPLYTIIKGGGIFSMWKAALVVFISCALAGILEGTDMLKGTESTLRKANSRKDLFLYTAIVSGITAAVGCSQAIAVVLTNQLMGNIYKERNVDSYQLAIDLENTGIVLAAIIPWSLAAFVPTTTMNVSATGFIPYAFYIYFIPITNFMQYRFSKTHRNEPPINFSDSKI
ncbi:Na+/H+ antiporter NhaC family protein [Alkaliphilus oremlandii]|uniref:Na+/H+ antiporter NhaC n=1 Tax=Alkaliphilus oremlandii (strain OhILAs) TaxID=350688 RepID=A8MKD8_ALKOO|nr:Na+/H+ antiporter NhaC family protein [Alkaliphilus oremlandii]ABW20270.1 Na+/H+ antiporter NhaC [Alkaliphilus oremlandii OhILAs]